MMRLMVAILAVSAAVLGGGLAAYTAAAQDEAAPLQPMAPPAPYDSQTGSIPPPVVKEPPVSESNTPENPLVESAPQNGATANNQPAGSVNGEGRFTFSRVTEGYVRLDHRTGQVSFCSKRAVGWTCQLAPEDSGAFENEVARLQEENAALKKELLTRGVALPGPMKTEPPVVRNDRPFAPPNDPTIERVKGLVEKAWRQLVDMITALQKDVLKKTS